MARILLLVVLALTIGACDFVDVMKDGMEQSGEVAKELEEMTGIKPLTPADLVSPTFIDAARKAYPA